MNKCLFLHSALLALSVNAPLLENKKHHSVVVKNNMQSFAIRNHMQAHTDTLTLETRSVKKHRHVY